MSIVKSTDKDVLIKSGSSLKKGNVEYVHTRVKEVVSTSANLLRGQKDGFILEKPTCGPDIKGGPSTSFVDKTQKYNQKI